MFAMFGLGIAEVIVLALIGCVILVVVMRSARSARTAGTEIDLRAEVERLYDEVARLRDQLARLREQLEQLRNEKDGARTRGQDPPLADTGIKPM